MWLFYKISKLQRKHAKEKREVEERISSTAASILYQQKMLEYYIERKAWLDNLAEAPAPAEDSPTPPTGAASDDFKYVSSGFA